MSISNSTSAPKTIALESLAIFGGPPAFEQPLHVGRPNIASPERFFERMSDAFQRRWLSNHGPFVKEFEARISDMLGVEHTIAVVNATLGLEIMLQAAQVTGEVIVPAFTFVATAHAISRRGLTPVFCDVAPGTFHIDPRQVEALITPATSAILGVHIWGQPCEIDALEELAGQHRLKLLFDAAHAFACSHRGRMIGNFGLAEVFSFHATKFINALEGGAICTNDAALAGRARSLLDFGFQGADNVALLGTNAKMNEASAAMGLTNLDGITDIVRANQRNYRAYQRELQWLDGVAFQAFAEKELANFQYIVLEIDPDKASLTRDELLAALVAENVLARRYFYPGIHRVDAYRNGAAAAANLPHTDRLNERVLLLPTGTAIELEDVDRICQLVRCILGHGEQVARRLRGDQALASSPTA